MDAGARRTARLGLLETHFESHREHMGDRQAVLGDFRPEEAAVEQTFVNKDGVATLKLGQARGVAMLAASSAGLTVAEYAPLSVKSAVVGYGRAEKQQVQHMVQKLLKLPELPEPPDVADALAIAICHLHTAATLRGQRAM